ncbi:MAG: hypothetical protein IPK07_23105 [Deltaproteobacteria bacterium]|nr:hypothetical protein [Deltaproteobacteria bacterium]
MKGGSSALASSIPIAAHAAASLAAFVAGYASGAELELSIVMRGLVLATPIGAALAATWSAGPEAGGRTIVRGVVLATGAGFALGYALGTINGADPMPFMYGA